ncbi:MAG: UbiA family prenyltransferase [Planctomycetaceae bacterium]|nr:UbiA family prenyltransferase [Planctomycetaceae bacterium]
MPILRLLRLPALFTTFPDVLAGYVIMGQGVVNPVELACLLASSACLYLSGMVLNDLFDVEQDRKERPDRPIPAGEVTYEHAKIMGKLLMLSGVAFASLVSLPAMIVSIALAASILVYDYRAKRTALGPFFMGLCRSLNLLLGASYVQEFSLWESKPQLAVAGLIGLYVAGVTLFARSEATQSKRFPLVAGIIFCWLAIIGWGISAATWAPASVVSMASIMLLLITFQLARKAIPAIRTGKPQHVQQTIRIMLLSIPMLEAVVILCHGGPQAVPWAIAAALMILPGQFLARYISMT